MPNNRVLSVPAVLVNNIPISIIPNTFKVKMGRGETKVESASQGGGASSSVHSEDAKTRVGEMKWEMYCTEDAITFFHDWKANTGSNYIATVQPFLNPMTMAFASLCNDPEFEFTADGKVAIEFKGDPVSSV